jgi:hypothetical protein
MIPSESELVAIRLTRMKNLVEALEAACAQGIGQQKNFLKLKQELEAVRAVVKPATD